MTIHIEISKSYKKDLWKIRFGDIEGCSESINITEEELLDEIKDEIRKEKEEAEL